MKKSRKLLVVTSIIMLLILISAMIFAYLYMATDTFKSKKELFAKYFGQNIDVFQKMADSKTIETYKNLKNENKYEANTNIKLIHSEGGEISNPFNNLSATLDIQNDNEEQYMYANGKIMFEEESFFETEIIKEQEVYGIRFTDLVKQFVSINNNEETKEVLEELGINQTQLQSLVDLNTQIKELDDKYLNIITKTIENGVFEKSVIDKTNIHSVFLSSENVENMIVEILDNLKNDEKLIECLELITTKEVFINNIDNEIKKINNEIEVPTITITVFEEKQKTIKTEIEIDVYKITIENVDENGNLTTNINYLDGEQAKEYKFKINKKISEAQEDFEFAINGFDGEEEYTIKLLSSMQLANNDEIQLDIELSQLRAITNVAIVIESQINVGHDFERKQTLDLENNITLNEIDKDSRTKIISYLKESVQKNINENVDILKVKLGFKNEDIQEKDETEEEMSEVDINKFNAKFEFYIGDEVSSESVKSLLDVVKNNLKSYENIENDAAENTGNSTKEKVNIKLNIEKDTINETSVNEIIEKITNNKKYKILIYYKESNNLIDYITITEV